MGKTSYEKGAKEKINEFEKKIPIPKVIGDTYDEIAKSIGVFTKNSYISQPESRKKLEKNNNLRAIFLLLVGAREPLMVGDFKDKLSISKPARYKIFHDLREMGLVKKIAIINALMAGSPQVKNEDFIKDDLGQFNKQERTIVLKKFRKWTEGIKSDKQKQNYIAGTFYWAISDNGKDVELLKWVGEIENSYRKQEEKIEENP